MKSIKMITALTLMIVTVISIAQQGGNFEIKKAVLDSGGGNSSGGNFEVNGAIGQADASNDSSGGGFSVSGGFWAQGVRPDAMFKDGFEN